MTAWKGATVVFFGSLALLVLVGTREYEAVFLALIAASLFSLEQSLFRQIAVARKSSRPNAYRQAKGNLFLFAFVILVVIGNMVFGKRAASLGELITVAIVVVPFLATFFHWRKFL